MDADRLAAIGEWFIRLSPFIGQGAEAYAYFQELKASIDALQAENERLRHIVQQEQPGVVRIPASRDFIEGTRGEWSRLCRFRFEQTPSGDYNLIIHDEPEDAAALQARVTLLERLLGRACEDLEHNWRQEPHSQRPPTDRTCLRCAVDAALSRSDQNTSDDAT